MDGDAALYGTPQLASGKTYSRLPDSVSKNAGNDGSSGDGEEVDFIESVVEGLLEAQRALAAGLGTCEAAFKQSVRDSAKELRPMLKPDKLLDAQNHLDNITRAALPAARELINDAAARVADAVAAVTSYKRIQQIIKRFALRNLAKAFNKWVEVLENTNSSYNKLLASNGAMQLLKRCLRSGLAGRFDHWKDMAELGRTERDKKESDKRELEALRTMRLKVVWERMSKSSMARGYNTWVEACAARLERLRKRKQAELEFQEAEAKRKEEELQRLGAEAEKLQQERCAAILRRFLMAEAARALNLWKEEFRNNKRLRAVVKKMKNRGLSMAWGLWLEVYEEVRERKNLMKKAAQRMRMAAVSGAFLRWAEMVEEAQDLKAKLKKAAMKMLLRGVSMAFENWASVTEEMKNQRVLLKRVALKMQNRGIAMAWDTWCEQVEEALDLKRKMQKVIMRIKNAGLANAFATWWEVIEEKHDMRDKMYKVAMRIKNMAVAGTFDNWASHVEEAREQRFKVRRTLNKMLKRGMADAFTEWADYVMELRHGNEEDQQKEKEAEIRAERALLKLKNRALVSAFDRWAEMAEEAAEMRFKCQKIVKRIQNMAYAGAWSAWCDMVEEAENMRNLLRKAAMKMMMRGASMCFNAWAEATEEAIETRVKLQRIALKMKNSAIIGAWSRWCEMTEEAVEMRVKLQRVAAKMKNRELSGAFARWAEMTEEAIEMRVKIRRTLNKMLKRSMTDTYYAWADHVMYLKHGDEDDQRKAQEAEVRAARALLKIKNRAIAGAFDRWCEMTEEAVEMRVKLERCAAKMRNREILGAWSRWCEMVEEAVEMRVMLERCAAKMRNREILGAWSRWCEMTEESIEMRVKLQRIAARMKNSGLIAAFESWCEMVEGNKETAVKLKRVLLRMQNACAFKAWACWHEYVTNLKTIRAVFVKMTKQKMASAFRSWQKNVRQAEVNKLNDKLNEMKLGGSAKQALAGAEILIPLLKVLNILLEEESRRDKLIRSRDKSRVQSKEVNNLIIRLKDWSSQEESARDKKGFDILSEVTRGATLLHREFAAMADLKVEMSNKFEEMADKVDFLTEEPRRHRLRVFEFIRQKLFGIINKVQDDREVRHAVQRVINAMKPGGRFEKRVSALDSDGGDAWLANEVNMMDAEAFGSIDNSAAEIVEEESYLLRSEDSSYYAQGRASRMSAEPSPGVNRFMPQNTRGPQGDEDGLPSVEKVPGMQRGSARRATMSSASTLNMSKVNMQPDMLPMLQRKKRGSISPMVADGPSMLPADVNRDGVGASKAQAYAHAMDSQGVSRQAHRASNIGADLIAGKVNTNAAFLKVPRQTQGKLPSINSGGPRSQSSLGVAPADQSESPAPRADSALEIR
ncbi:protein SFI1 [Pycnococcus provasolii]